MTGRHSFADLRSRMSPKAKAEEAAETLRLEVEMNLSELRRALRLSQEEIAQLLNVRQGSVAKMERRTDMYVSTVRRFIEAMGGRLEITAHFEERVVKIGNFSDLSQDDQHPEAAH
jgi:transcriptional regulator with XRE-family HTH domain